MVRQSDQHQAGIISNVVPLEDAQRKPGRFFFFRKAQTRKLKLIPGGDRGWPFSGLRRYDIDGGEEDMCLLYCRIPISSARWSALVVCLSDELRVISS